MKVCFTYSGPLQYRGRLFKQIRTLQNAGVECVLIHGQTESEAPDYSIYDFPVIPVRVIEDRFKILTLASQLQFAQKAAKLIAKSGANTVVCVALQSALSGAIAKSRNPALRFIFDNNELSLEMIGERLKRKIWSFIHDYILKQADVIIHAEQRRLEYFHRTYKTAARPFLLENLPFFRPDISGKPARSKAMRCVYIGGFFPGRYCEEMLIGFSRMNGSEVTFDMVGFYAPASYQKTINDLLTKIDTSRIRILPPVSHRDIYDFLSRYDIGLAFYKNTNLNNYYCAPNKVYDYIQMGMPVITNDYPGLIDVVQNHHLGVCIKAVDTERLQDAVQKIEADDMFANITEPIRTRYSWENQEKQYAQLFF